MDDKMVRAKVHAAVEQHCAASGVQPNPYLAQRVLNAAHEKGEKKMKRKFSVGLVLAIVIMLATVTAVAAILLSGKEFVNQFLAPLSSHTQEDQWSETELEQILTLAEENGVEMTEEIRTALESKDPVYKEELLRLFMKIDLGFYPAAWPLEEQVWYDELLVKYGLKEDRTRFLPTEGEISEEEALGIAKQYILENWQVDVTQGQYTRYVQFMLSEDDETGVVSKVWDIEYEAEDGTMYVLAITPDGSVIEDGFASYVAKPRIETSDYESDVSDDVMALAELMLNDDFYTVDTLASFRSNYAALIESSANSKDSSVILMQMLLEIPYAEPRATDIRPDDAFASAKEAAQAAGWTENWLDRCKYSISYRDYNDAEPVYRICFKLKADQRDLFYKREMPFGIVIYIDPTNSDIISINELNELDEYDRYCEFPDPHDSYDSLGNG